MELNPMEVTAIIALVALSEGREFGETARLAASSVLTEDSIWTRATPSAETAEGEALPVSRSEILFQSCTTGVGSASNRTVVAYNANVSIPGSYGPSSIPYMNTSLGESKSSFTHSGTKPNESSQFEDIEPLNRCAEQSLPDPGGYLITAQSFYRAIYHKRLDWEFFQCDLERNFVQEADAFKKNLRFTT